MFKKIVVTIIMSFAFLALTIPLMSYKYSLSLLESFPEKPAIKHLTDVQLMNEWNIIEPNLSVSEMRSVTPYWIYSWLLSVILKENVKNESYSRESRLSHTCSLIAASHLRLHKPNNLKMLVWHLLNIHLTIWIQRNWSEEEIINKYEELNL